MHFPLHDIFYPRPLFMIIPPFLRFHNLLPSPFSVHPYNLCWTFWGKILEGMSPKNVSFVSFLGLNTALYGLTKPILNKFDWVNWLSSDNIDIFLPNGDIIHTWLYVETNTRKLNIWQHSSSTVTGHTDRIVSAF